jgi:hypothetical protein
MKQAFGFFERPGPRETAVGHAGSETLSYDLSLAFICTLDFAIVVISQVFTGICL